MRSRREVDSCRSQESPSKQVLDTYWLNAVRLRLTPCILFLEEVVCHMAALLWLIASLAMFDSEFTYCGCCAASRMYW